MDVQTIIRSWKDEDFRKTLSAKAPLPEPEDPAGDNELSDDDLEDVAGGGGDTSPLCMTNKS
jgi:mersacidin/lichenicidin family type 2 lantibiotic